MKQQLFSARGRFACIVCLASMLGVAVSAQPASAQVKQGKFITQAAERLTMLVDEANGEGYKLQSNSFSIGGGWLKKSEKWVGIYTVKLVEGEEYRFLASGDGDAKDVDLRVLNDKGKQVAIDDGVAVNAVVNYSPKVSGIYTVQIRLFDSKKNFDCVCLSVMMVK